MNIHPALIVVFAIVIIVMLLLDLGVFHKENKEVSTKNASIWVAVWISLSMAFSVFVYMEMGWDAFANYQSAYWIEESLSIDNLFVFVLVFNQFKVPKELRHKVLYYGVIGAIVFRAIFIFAGVELIKMTYLPPFNLFGYHLDHFNVLLFIFGIFLIYASINSLKHGSDEAQDYNESFGVKLVRNFFKVDNNYHGNKFFVVLNGVKYATPLFMVLVIIELTDIVFAVDSIPAIFSITQDPVILYTSNIFAIMGLRSLYFVLANVIDRFHYLKYGLAAILFFIGMKMIIEPFYKFQPTVSLLVIISMLSISIIISLTKKPKEA